MKNLKFIKNNTKGFTPHTSKKVWGFTLIEILISSFILVSVATISIVYLSGYQRTVAVNTEAEKIAAYLRQAQNRVMSGESFVAWGVHFVNPQSGDDYYALFQGSVYTSTSLVETIYLSKQIEFTVPSASSTQDVVFQRITGWPTATTSVTIVSKVNSNLTKTISVNSVGQVNY